MSKTVLRITKPNNYKIVPIKNDDDNLVVCEHCLCAIESKEGNQITEHLYFDDEQVENEEDCCRCMWCDDYFSELYKIY